MKAFIFAAGLGTRLRPLTLDKPKALVEVGGKTMLERTITTLKDAGFSDFVINVHHFADKIEKYLAENDNFGCNTCSFYRWQVDSLSLSHQGSLLN